MSSKTSWRFWLGAALTLVVGVPVAVGVRHGRVAPAEHEHAHGGDATVGAELERQSGAARKASLARFLADPAPTKRLAAAEALDQVPDSDRLPLVAQALTDNDSRIRVEAVHALTRADTPAAEPLLRAALRDEDAWVRQTVVQSLASQPAAALKARGPWLVPDLMGRLDDSDPGTRSLATAALRKCTGNPWHLSAKATPSEASAAVAKWKRWWLVEKAKRPAVAAVATILPQRTEPAPEVVLHTVDGRQIAPARGGQVTLINFWGTWCGPCQQEVPDLQRLHALYGARGVRVVGVALSEPDGATGLRAWCAKKGVTYPQTLADEAVTEAYGDVHEVPQTVLVDRSGRIRYRWHGEREGASFQSAIERLLN